MDCIKQDYALFITSNYFYPGQPGSTGGTISNHFLVEQIARRFRVVFLLLGHEDTTYDTGDVSIEIVRHPSPLWSGFQLAKHWLPFVKAQTEALIRERGAPKVILATNSTVCSMEVARERSIPGLVIVRAFENFGIRPPKVTFRTRISLAKQAIVRRFSDTRHMRMADIIVTNSQFMSQSIQDRFGIGKDRIRVITPLCDVVPMRQTPAGVENVIGFVNRSSDKNLDFVFELARELSNRRFAVYGAAPGDPTHAPANVEFCGWESDRNRMFAQAALWIVPSSWPEPFGRVSMEAQAANRRVLVADIGGLPETVADPRYLIKGFDPKAWAKHIRELMEIPEEVVTEIGATIRARFSAEAHARAVRECLDHLLYETPPTRAIK